MGATQAKADSNVDTKQIAADLMKGFDLDNDFMLDIAEIECFRDYCVKNGVSASLADGLAKLAKEGYVASTPKAIDDLLKFSKLTQYKEALTKAGAKDLGTLLKLKPEELGALAKKAGLKIGHLARLRRALKETKESADQGASTIGNSGVEGMVPKSVVEEWAKTINLSASDAEKLKKICLDSVQDRKDAKQKKDAKQSDNPVPDLQERMESLGPITKESSSAPTFPTDDMFPHLAKYQAQGQPRPRWVETKGGMMNLDEENSSGDALNFAPGKR